MLEHLGLLSPDCDLVIHTLLMTEGDFLKLKMALRHVISIDSGSWVYTSAIFLKQSTVAGWALHFNRSGVGLLDANYSATVLDELHLLSLKSTPSAL